MLIYDEANIPRDEVVVVDTMMSEVVAVVTVAAVSNKTKLVAHNEGNHVVIMYNCLSQYLCKNDWHREVSHSLTDDDSDNLLTNCA